MVAADGVVVGDRAAAVDQRLGDGGLDLVPLLDLAAADRRREHGEVGRGAVGVDVGEAAADAGRAGPLGGDAADLGDRAPRVVSITVAWNSSKRSQVIAVSKVSESTPQATKVSRRYGASRNAPRQAPDARPPRSAASARLAASLGGPRMPPWLRGDRQRQRPSGASTGWWADSKPRIRRLALPSPAPVSSGLGGVEQAAVGGVEAGLGDLAHRAAPPRGSRRTRRPPRP